MARKLFGFQQLRNALRTLGYILFMYLFSISLTFYNKWFLQVCLYCCYLQGTWAQINPADSSLFLGLMLQSFKKNERQYHL